MNRGIKSRLFEVMETAKPGDLPSRFFSIFMTVLILLNVIAVILETVEGLFLDYRYYFRIFEVVSVAIFTIEYLMRLLTCTTDARYKGQILGRLHYALTPLALVDLLAIFPFYLPVIIPFDLRFIRILRFIRLARILKVGRYFDSMKMMGSVVKSKKEELIVSIAMVIILLIIASGLMYFIENEAQPKAFANIPAAMWWGVATLTTVGYGDMYPITTAGKLLGAIIALLGIGIFALPAGILASGMVEMMYKKHNKESICPHCGKKIAGPEK
jgi:voltage-gated potassium channel